MSNDDDNKKCPTCKNTMDGYYGYWCPRCTSSRKVKKNLIQSIRWIQTRYGIDTRDYAARELPGNQTTSSWNFAHRAAWEEKYFPIPEEYTTNPLKNYSLNELGMAWYATQAGRDFFANMRKAYAEAPDGECLERPLQDYWIFLCDMLDISNDSIRTVCWPDLLDSCQEEWQRDITKLFMTHFGSKPYRVEISW
jgi:hypothetical protein